jgi:hypothetical protein
MQQHSFGGVREPAAWARTSAGQVYNMYAALVQEGFTADQALVIITNMVCASIAAQGGQQG